MLSVVVVIVLGMLLPAMTQASDNRALDVASTDVVLEFETIAGGFFQPTHMSHAGDGSNRLFVVERIGPVRIVQDGELLPEPFIDIGPLVLATSGERGFFAIAFHPDFTTNGYFYVHYTAQPDGAVTVSRFQVSDDDPNKADPDSELTILSVPHPFDIHNGGGLGFGPDGYLYISIGDGGGLEDGDPDGNAQNLNSLLGKVLRIDVDAGEPYAIPPDNPFVDDADARPEVWAYGLRNPWRISFDRKTGDLYISDVGSGGLEELNYQPAGHPGGINYGWPVLEGTQCFPFWAECDAGDFEPPILEYAHDLGCSISGTQVYRGEATPFMQGSLIYGDWCSGRIWIASPDFDGEWIAEQLMDTEFGITAIEEDEAGELYVTDMWRGQLVKLLFQEVDSGLVISELSPSGAIAGAEGFPLTVTGSGFNGTSVVRWNGRPLPTTFVSDTELIADVSGDDLGMVASVDITITVATLGAVGKVSNAVIFSINAFGDAAFEQTWRRTDKVLVDAEAVRTWIWGPRPITNPRFEPYLESPDNERLVQYFDKSRMEINDPSGDADSIWYVTNGLLVMEMMSGDLQIGDGTFEEREPTEVNIAGDATDPNGVTYATFATLAGHEPIPEGWTLTQVVNRQGELRHDPFKARYGVTAGPYVAETNHRVASVFWEFMRSEGLVYDGDEKAEAPLFIDPFYATGFPVTEAYWTTVEVGGVAQNVLVQAFERRVLTFTPANTPEWQVEAGNVGRHYFVWRYGEHLLPFNR
jgi:glucose/arabinose dehydrogenase